MPFTVDSSLGVRELAPTFPSTQPHGATTRSSSYKKASKQESVLPWQRPHPPPGGTHSSPQQCAVAGKACTLRSHKTPSPSPSKAIPGSPSSPAPCAPLRPAPPAASAPGTARPTAPPSPSHSERNPEPNSGP